MSNPGDIIAVASRFAIQGRPVAAQPFSGGHIHESYLVSSRWSGQTAEYLLQRINTVVFPRPEQVVSNIRRVTSHIADNLRSRGVHDLDRRVLKLIPVSTGETFLRDDRGSCWRVYRFIGGSHSRQTVRTARQAEDAGRAFGMFQRLLSDWPGSRLHETIPGFHDTSARFRVMEQAIQADAAGRAAAVQEEIGLLMRHQALAGVLLDLHHVGAIPERIVHNDAKISNILFDDSTGEALCVVDLDTVMPGLSLYDFGDMVRSMTCTAAEDEPDTSKVKVRLSFFEALARGYLGVVGEFLTGAEREHLVVAGKLIVLEQAVRFLTDYLNGDCYYRTNRPGHNLDRCRTQLKLLESLDENEARLTEIVAGLLGSR
ncbi:MAG TPA: aminoglycoside phosphotransferase family protein [Phycisphaerae bacterium]|nr:aminoglycoside phosphotransferase family protein [Phycisphaerae bacterium]